MIIIGKTSDGFVVTATNSEMANLIGYYYDSAESKVGSMKTGDVINIHAMYKQLYALSGARKKITEAQKSLREMADSLERVAPVIPLCVTKD